MGTSPIRLIYYVARNWQIPRRRRGTRLFLSHNFLLSLKVNENMRKWIGFLGRLKIYSYYFFENSHVEFSLIIDIGVSFGQLTVDSFYYSLRKFCVSWPYQIFIKKEDVASVLLRVVQFLKSRPILTSHASFLFSDRISEIALWELSREYRWWWFWHALLIINEPVTYYCGNCCSQFSEYRSILKDATVVPLEPS